MFLAPSSVEARNPHPLHASYDLDPYADFSHTTGHPPTAFPIQKGKQSTSIRFTIILLTGHFRSITESNSFEGGWASAIIGWQLRNWEVRYSLVIQSILPLLTKHFL